MLPDGFVFSQSSLQDYADCPRRFLLRYLRHCRWPAPRTADALLWEQVTQKGYAFHRLMRQLQAGLPEAGLEQVAALDTDLRRWWEAYQSSPPQALPEGFRRAEAALSTVVSGFRLEARFDLLAGSPGGRWVIVDWKTNARRSERRWLDTRLQTHVYPFVLVSAGGALNGHSPISAANVELRYWFAEFPAQPERLVYDEELYATDRARLEHLIAEVAKRARDIAPGGSDAESYPRTQDLGLCRFCVYRSLCWDQVQAGCLSESESTEAEDIESGEIEFESIVPIPF